MIVSFIELSFYHIRKFFPGPVTIISKVMSRVLKEFSLFMYQAVINTKISHAAVNLLHCNRLASFNLTQQPRMQLLTKKNKKYKNYTARLNVTCNS